MKGVWARGEASLIERGRGRRKRRRRERAINGFTAFFYHSLDAPSVNRALSQDKNIQLP